MTSYSYKIYVTNPTLVRAVLAKDILLYEKNKISFFNQQNQNFNFWHYLALVAPESQSFLKFNETDI